MSALQMLEQLLKSADQSLKTRNLDGKSLLAGGAAGGALALLLGSRRGRKLGGTALKVGGVAALGALAYTAYQRWQAQQGTTGGATSGGGGTLTSVSPSAPGFAALPPPQLEQHGQAMLKAMIAAAKSDGHLDERERALVKDELQRIAADATTRRWVEDELQRPIDPADVARAATTPEMAAEVYLASVLVVDDTTPMERAYLDALARELKLAPSLQKDLEAQAAQAMRAPQAQASPT